MPDLYPYQIAGAMHLAKHANARGRAGLFDEMGVGKTAQAVRAADMMGPGRGVIVCPAVARPMWIREWNRWAIHQRRIIPCRSHTDVQQWLSRHADIIVMSYDGAYKFAPFIRHECEPFDFLILDEAHYLKNHKAKRTKAILGDHANNKNSLAQWAIRGWWMTGTPSPNDPTDIWTYLKFVGRVSGGHTAFLDTYFVQGVSGTYVARRESAAILTDLIAADSLRRSIAHSLPGLTHRVHYITGDSSAIDALLAEHPDLREKILALLDDPHKGSPTEHVATLRRLIGEAKALPYAHELIYDLKNGLPKKVVFAHHVNVIRTLADELTKEGIKFVQVTGGTADRDREAAERGFQADPAVQVFLGNIKAAGVAITLTAAQHVDLLESDWTPAGNAQAIMRVHRLTQTKPVIARIVTLANSFDERINDIVLSKLIAIRQVQPHAENAA